MNKFYFHGIMKSKCDCKGRVIDYPRPAYPSICGECGGWF